MKMFFIEFTWKEKKRSEMLNMHYQSTNPIFDGLRWICNRQETLSCKFPSIIDPYSIRILSFNLEIIAKDGSCHTGLGIPILQWDKKSLISFKDLIISHK